MTTNNLTSRLTAHPRLLGVLFALTLALSQAGTAAAGMCTAYHGP
jgi:hypothetical protein